MNLPSDYLAKIAHGKNADQTAEDGRLFVPPILVPSFPVPRPAPVDSDCTGDVINDSKVSAVYAFRQNLVAADVVAFYLLAGLWEVTCHSYVRWNFALTAGSPAVNFDIMDQAGTRAIGALWSAFSSGAAGIFQETFKWRFHVKPRPDLNVVQGDVWTFFLGIAATNGVATDSIDVQLGLIFERFL